LGTLGSKRPHDISFVFCFGCGRLGDVGDVWAGLATPLYRIYTLCLLTIYKRVVFFLRARRAKNVPNVPNVPKFLVSDWIDWIESMGTFFGNVPIYGLHVPSQGIQQTRDAAGRTMRPIAAIGGREGIDHAAFVPALRSWI
jgi:hypothetical protein